MDLYNNYIKVRELKDNLTIDGILEKYDSTSPFILGVIEDASEKELVGKIALFRRVTKVSALNRFYIQKQDLIATLTKNEYKNFTFSKIEGEE